MANIEERVVSFEEFCELYDQGKKNMIILLSSRMCKTCKEMYLRVNEIMEKWSNISYHLFKILNLEMAVKCGSRYNFQTTPILFLFVAGEKTPEETINGEIKGDEFEEIMVKVYGSHSI